MYKIKNSNIINQKTDCYLSVIKYIHFIFFQNLKLN